MLLLLNHSPSTKVAESVVPDAYKSPFMAHLITQLGAQSEVAIGALHDFDVNGCELLVAQSLWQVMVSCPWSPGSASA